MHHHSFQESDARVLIAGGSADIPAIRRILDRVPSGTYGQVFIEIASPVQIRSWPVPTGVTVTWLRRERDSAVPQPMLPKGELLARAVAAWMTEWLPEDEPDLPGFVWVGGATSRAVDRVYVELSRRLGLVHSEPSGPED